MDLSPRGCDAAEQNGAGVAGDAGADASSDAAGNTDTCVYFASTSGTLGGVATGGGPVVVLALGPTIDPYASFMAVDESSVYWTAGEKIWMRAK